MLHLKRTATLVDDHAWVYSGDDAMDKTDPEFDAKYKRALEVGDLSLVPTKPGSRPTVFWLRHPRGLLRRHIGDVMSGDMAKGLRRIAALTIVKVENDGIDTEWATSRDKDGFPCVPPELMDILDEVDKGILVNDIGWRISEVIRPSPL